MKHRGFISVSMHLAPFSAALRNKQAIDFESFNLRNNCSTPGEKLHFKCQVHDVIKKTKEFFGILAPRRRQKPWGEVGPLSPTTPRHPPYPRPVRRGWGWGQWMPRNHNIQKQLHPPYQLHVAAGTQRLLLYTECCCK